MFKVILASYESHELQFNSDGWFNATIAAARFDRKPAHWLDLDSTKEYIECLSTRIGKSNIDKPDITLVKTKRGNTPTSGTWLHPKLAVKFARWLSVDFEIWCDEQIDGIIHRPVQQTEWQRLRHETAASFKVMAAMLEAHRLENGKETKAHHYSNEARLVNFALCGQFAKIDRETLSDDELDRLAMLEQQNTLMIARGDDYEKRKAALVRLAAGKLKLVK